MKIVDNENEKNKTSKQKEGNKVRMMENEKGEQNFVTNIPSHMTTILKIKITSFTIFYVKGKP